DWETAPSQIRGMLISLKDFFMVPGWCYMYASATPLCLIMEIGMCWTTLGWGGSGCGTLRRRSPKRPPPPRCVS
ncbi:hypothetical protein ACJX0J_007381, partial [Zea mays]